MLKSFAFAIATAFCASVGAASAQVMIKGRMDCGMRLDARASSQAVVLEHYSQGFFNGLAVGRNAEFWDAPGHPPIEPAQVFAWLDKYCREDPLREWVTGVVSLFNSRSQN